MPGTPTPRLGLPTTLGADFISDFPAVFDEAMALLDPAALDFQGPIADRVSVPQERGVWYWATDDHTFGPNGTPYRHDGITWRMMGSAPPDLSGYQLHDADLDAIAALVTTPIGRSLLAGADAATLRAIAGAQQQDADLDAIAALVTTAFGRGLLALADAAALRATIGVPKITRSATKPVAPADGDEWVYPADANGRLWRFRWNNTAARWEQVGGEPLMVQVATVQVSGPDAAYGNPDGGAFPTLTLPFAGLYRIGIGARRGNAQPMDGNRLAALTINGGMGNWPISLMDGAHYENWWNRAANDVLTLHFRTNDSTTATYNDVELWAIPITVT